MPGWKWDSASDKWKITPYRGYAKGQAADPPTNEIVVWPEVHDYDASKPLSEQPGFLAESLRTLAHECLHFKCPAHAGPPPGTVVPNPPANPASPPMGDGRDPDCNDINYALHTAAALCAQIQQLFQNGESIPGIPGTDTAAGRCAYCEALKKAYKKIQDRWNNGDNAETAEGCACGEDGPWDPEDEEEPGDDFSDCPNFPPPPGGCEGQPPFPDNKIVPDCECTCPCDN